MTEQDHERAEARGGSPLPGPAGRLALAFEAFRALHREAWSRYARTQVGDAAAAEQVVETVARQLALDWAHALRRESVAEYAWAILKEHIAQWLRDHGRSPALAGTDPSGTAIHELLEISRERFAGLEGEDGLYAALGRLPERQYDVLVLRYVLGYPEDRVAAYLGIAASAVRSHIRRAERRLTGEAEESRLPPVAYGDAPPPAAPNGGTAPAPPRLPSEHEQAAHELDLAAALVLGAPQAATSLSRLGGLEDDIEPEGALVFACLLHITRHDEAAQFWWQFAAGGGSRTAAYCLYLHHRRLAEFRDADFWRAHAARLVGALCRPRRRPEVMPALLPDAVREDLLSQCHDGRHPRLPAALEAVINRLRVIGEDEDFGEVPQPHRGLAADLATGPTTGRPDAAGAANAR